MINPTQQSQFSELINENNPKELRKIIEKLINKSKILIQSLQNALTKLQYAKEQKQYWQQSYFTFKESCENYISNQGIAPFTYIYELEAQLDREKIAHQAEKQKVEHVYRKGRGKKIEKNMEKFTPNSTMGVTIREPFTYNKISPQQHKSSQQPSTLRKDEFEKLQLEPRMNINKSISVLSQGRQSMMKNKHRIGPKKMSIFKFGQQFKKPIKTDILYHLQSE